MVRSKGTQGTSGEVLTMPKIKHAEISELLLHIAIEYIDWSDNKERKVDTMMGMRTNEGRVTTSFQ